MTEIQVYTDERELTIILNKGIIKYTSNINIISDLDKNEKLYGIEVFLYEDQNINYEKIFNQFKESDDIEIYDGILYLYLRKKDPNISRGRGFGRNGIIGIDDEELLHKIQIPWNEPGSGNPIIDSHKALNGLLFINGRLNQKKE